MDSKTWRWLPGLAWFAAASIIAIYVQWIRYYALQIPNIEDVSTTFQPVMDLYHSDSWGERYEALTRQNSDHRLLASHLVAIASQEIFGFINVHFLYLTGALMVIAIIVLVYLDQVGQRVYSEAHYLLLYLLLVLNPGFRTSVFAAWGISNYASVLFPLFGISCLLRRSWYGFGGFEFFNYLSVNTQGNGLLMVFLGAYYYCCDTEGKNKTRLLAHMAVSCAVVFVYYLGYEDLGLARPALAYLGEHPLAEMVFSGAGFFTWVGQWILLREDVMHDYPLMGVLVTAAVGFFLFGAAAASLYHKNKKQPLSRGLRWYLLIYMLGTVLGAVWERCLLASAYWQSTRFADLWFVLDTRYTFYSVMLLLLGLSLILPVGYDSADGQRFGSFSRQSVLLLAFAVCYAGGRYVYSIPEMETERRAQLACIEKWHQLGKAGECLWNGETKIIMHQEEAAGFLRIEK
jgi:hypothetical protein